MGDVKAALTPTPSKPGGIMSVWERRKAERAGRTGKTLSDQRPPAEQLAGLLDTADSQLNALLLVKENDLKHEKGSEAANTVKLNQLRTMKYHLDAMIDVGLDYLGQG